MTSEKPQAAMRQNRDFRSPQDFGSLAHLIPLAAILMLALGLLLASAASRSLWIDEHFSVAIAAEDNLSRVLAHVTETERRPPLYYIMLFAWRHVAGTSDMAYRLPSLVWALVLLALTGRLARVLALPEHLSMLLMAVSPFMLLFAPMIRPYTMVAALALASTLAFLSWRESNRPAALITYVVLASLLLWTDYSAVGILLVHNLLALFFLPRRRWGWWAAGQVMIGALFLPWLGIAINHATENSPVAADLASGLLGLGLKLAYPVLSFTTGETIFPWDARGALGLLAVGLVAIVGFWTLWRKRAQGGINLLLFSIIYIAVPVLFIIALFTFLIAQGTFVLIPSRAMAAYPALIIGIAAGLQALPRRVALLAGVCIAIAWVTAFANLLAGTHYHNPIYAVRMRDLATQVAGDAQPGDAVLSDQDSLFFYYYPPGAPVANVFTDATDVASPLAAAKRVWLITLGRDRTRVSAPAANVLALLAGDGFVEQEHWGSGPEDPIYQKVKERLLKRPDYEYKALVQLFVRR